MKYYKDIMAIAFVLIAVLSRLIPHPPNFTPVDGMALFAVAYLGGWGVLFPIIVMLISDQLLGYGWHSTLFFVYGSMLLTASLGLWIRKNNRPVCWVIGATGSSVIFFLITNFGVWCCDGMYDRTLSGLIQCYGMGIPFYKNTLAGDLFYTVVLFGGYRVVSKLVTMKLVQA